MFEQLRSNSTDGFRQNNPAITSGHRAQLGSEITLNNRGRGSGDPLPHPALFKIDELKSLIVRRCSICFVKLRRLTPASQHEEGAVCCRRSETASQPTPVKQRDRRGKYKAAHGHT